MYCFIPFYTTRANNKRFSKNKENIDLLEVESLLNQENDSRNAIINIHPGAGGKESEDWAWVVRGQRWCE